MLAGVLLMGLVKMLEPKHDPGTESPISAITNDAERGVGDAVDAVDDAAGAADDRAH